MWKNKGRTKARKNEGREEEKKEGMKTEGKIETVSKLKPY